MGLTGGGSSITPPLSPAVRTYLQRMTFCGRCLDMTTSLRRLSGTRSTASVAASRLSTTPTTGEEIALQHTLADYGTSSTKKTLVTSSARHRGPQRRAESKRWTWQLIFSGARSS